MIFTYKFTSAKDILVIEEQKNDQNKYFYLILILLFFQVDGRVHKHFTTGAMCTHCRDVSTFSQRRADLVRE